MRKTKSKQHQPRLIRFIKVGLTVLVSVLIVFTVVKAGTITPPGGTPSAQFYTLSEIYTRLTTNATTTEGSHDFTFSDALAGIGRTLTEVYNAIPTIDPSKLLDNTTYLGITGNIATRTLSATSTIVNAGYYVATTLDAVDTNLATGNIKSGVSIFGVSGDPNVADTSSGTLTNNNQIRSSYVCYSDGTQYTGSLADCSSEGEQSCYTTGSYYAGTNVGQQTITPTTTNQTITQGYHDGTGYCAGDADLTAGNIKSGVGIFAVNGTLSPAGTAAVGDVCNSKTFYSGDSWTQKTGTRTACSSCAAGTADTSMIVSGKTADIDCDGTAETGVVDSLCFTTQIGTTQYHGCIIDETCTSFCSRKGLSCAGRMTLRHCNQSPVGASLWECNYFACRTLSATAVCLCY